MEYCDKCGGKLMARWERVSAILVKILIMFAKTVREKKRNSIRISKECDFNKSEYNNFQKLKFHQLVYKISNKEGHWGLTSSGVRFLRKELAIPYRVKVFRSNVIEKDTKTVLITSVIRDIPYLDRKEDFEYEELNSTMQSKLMSDPVAETKRKKQVNGGKQYVFDYVKQVYREVSD